MKKTFSFFFFFESYGMGLSESSAQIHITYESNTLT